jgi:hypothetical protein
MPPKSSTRFRPKQPSAHPQPALPTGTIQVLKQPDLQILSPVQRQRLDTAVMLLVKHLISASSQS